MAEPMGWEMDCREFRDKHSLLIDVRCSAIEEDEMREHMRRCPDCDRHDTRVRRSLLVARSLTPIEPSPGFRARLDARLREVAASPATAEHVTSRFARVAPRLPLFATAAAILLIVVIGAGLGARESQPIRMAPVVASTPAVDHSTLAGTALVATVPTGMSIWPAIMAASQVPMHLAATELVDER